MLACLLALGAAADPVDDLAPGPRELAAAQGELEARLVAAEAIGRAVARLQGAWATLPRTGDPCGDPARAPVTVRLRHFADAWHDAVQRARVQAERTRRLAAAPTVVPVIDAERRERLDLLAERARAQEAGWMELLAWIGRAAPHACDLPMVPAAGLRDPAPHARGEVEGAVAVTAVGGGWLCPAAIPAEGAVAVLAGAACWSAEPTCPCDPVPVYPGAVLGPPATSLNQGLHPELGDGPPRGP